MILKGFSALAGMLLLYFIFNATGISGAMAIFFSISVPLGVWYWVETRKKEDSGLTKAWNFVDYIDLADILDFIKK